MNGRLNLAADNIFMAPILFHTTDWNEVEWTTSDGESGVASYQTLQYGDLRIRKVKYSPGYKANHWCTKGHLLFIIEGDLRSELSDGRVFEMKAGMSYQVSDGVSSHRSTSKNGAELVIIDGGFLNSNKKTELNPWRM
jgi:hypothetical protein